VSILFGIAFFLVGSHLEDNRAYAQSNMVAVMEKNCGFEDPTGWKVGFEDPTGWKPLETTICYPGKPDDAASPFITPALRSFLNSSVEVLTGVVDGKNVANKAALEKDEDWTPCVSTDRKKWHAGFEDPTGWRPLPKFIEPKDNASSHRQLYPSLFLCTDAWCWTPVASKALWQALGRLAAKKYPIVRIDTRDKTTAEWIDRLLRLALERYVQEVGQYLRHFRQYRATLLVWNSKISPGETCSGLYAYYNANRHYQNLSYLHEAIASLIEPGSTSK